MCPISILSLRPCLLITLNIESPKSSPLSLSLGDSTICSLSGIMIGVCWFGISFTSVMFSGCSIARHFGWGSMRFYCWLHGILRLGLEQFHCVVYRVQSFVQTIGQFVNLLLYQCVVLSENSSIFGSVGEHIGELCFFRLTISSWI